MTTPPAADDTPFAVLGGDSVVRAIVDRFYDLMALDTQYAELRALHPVDLTGSRDKLYWFLSGWLGGPPLYAQKIGHPMLRARHLPYAIGQKVRDQWMICMESSLAEFEMPVALRERLLESLAGTADWMRNRPD
jgi:hemoglobin